MALAKWYKNNNSTLINIDTEKKQICYNYTPGRNIVGRNVSFETEEGIIHYKSDVIPVIYASCKTNKEILNMLEKDGFFVTKNDNFKTCIL